MSNWPTTGSCRETTELSGVGILLSCSSGPPVQVDPQHQWSVLREETSSKADGLQKDVASATVSNTRLVSVPYLKQCLCIRNLECLVFLRRMPKIAVTVKICLVDKYITNWDIYSSLVYFTE